jgi:GTP pyrophosphokinase
MKMSIAQCCHPVHGDDIVGYITKGEGVKVHRRDCPNVAHLQSRLIEVMWDEDVETEKTYDADLIVLAKDRSFLLTDIVTVVNQCKAPMTAISAVLNQDKLETTIKITVQIHNVEQLENVIANVRKVESVVDVSRMTR